MKICLSCTARYKTSELPCPFCGYKPKIVSGYLAYAPEMDKSINNFEEKYYQCLFDKEADYFWFKYRNLILQYFLDQYFPEINSFCEIGCGTGYVLSGISELRPSVNFTGVEIHTSSFPFAASRVPGATFIQADVCNFPFEEEYDVIGAFDVIEHIDNDYLAIKNIYRAVKSGGGAIFTVPQHQWLWTVFDEAACHKKRYSKKELLETIEKSGFKVKRATSCFTFLLPVMVLSRLKSNLSSKTHNPTAELKIHPLLNSLCYKICKFEQVFIKNAFNFPVGGSLVVVASK